MFAFSADYFGGFARALESSGFEVYWVHVSHSEALQNARLGTPGHRILDTTVGFVPDYENTDYHRRELAELEHESGPRINDIILMDRVLRHKSYEFAICYLAHVRRAVEAFLRRQSIRMVNSGRDTAAQLVVMLLCRKLGVGWVVPTRARIPRDLFMFTSGHETADVVQIRPATCDDRAWAERYLDEFFFVAPQPALKPAATGFQDVLRLLPRHIDLFCGLLLRAFADRGNDYSRYTIGRIVTMYFRRRYNLLRFKMFPPYKHIDSAPFCIYALHTQPESSIDVAGSFFSDQIALVTMITRSLPVSHELYVKIHQTDVDGKALEFYRALARIPGVRLINYDANSRQLVERAAIVFALTGTIGYEAAMLGKPVVTFARNFYNGLPAVHYCDAPPQLRKLVSRLLTAPPTRKELRRGTLEFLASLRANCFPGEFNRMYMHPVIGLTPEDLASLQEAYAAVYEIVSTPNEAVGQP